MAKFLNTSGTTYHLEELIKNAKERLILISPYLKLNSRIKELLEDKDRLKIDVRIIYGKSELQPAEVTWLKNLNYIRTSYCENLHAKCYLNENACIITSLNLYEFSQINNNEMGVLISKEEDHQLYQDTYEEAQRIVRISEEVKISLEVVDKESGGENAGESPNFSMLTTAKLAEKLGIKTADLNKKLCDMGYQEFQDKSYILTDTGKQAGAKTKQGKFGDFILWDENFKI